MEREGKIIKKIRFTVPHYIKEKIKEDENHFNLLGGEIGNRILKYYSDQEVEKNEIKSNKGEIVQFNLNKGNDELYDVILKEHGVQNEAEFFRDLFFQYLDNPRYIREKILFSENFTKIDEAIKGKRKLNIKYNREIRSIHPYFIKNDLGEDRSYLFCFCEVNNDYRNYRIANISKVTLSKNFIEEFDKEYIKNVEKNFDPFLSYGKEVVVKMNENSKKIYEVAILNRPKVLKKEEDTWTFQCTNKLAKIYFPQFLHEIEIMYPLELREWFKKNFEKTAKLYGR
ncbi:WYL domain-containing protein [Cetobacterium sp. SF1]|uniref:WYL domain-containing protein n=1 Tax=Cetobacterium sp. SF1 TaxID=3417654 RepID=UPI003CF156F2